MIRLGMIGLALAMTTGGSGMIHAMEDEPIVEVSSGSDGVSSAPESSLIESSVVENEDGSGEKSTVETSVFWIVDGETITDGARKYGEILTSIDEGEVGDEVTVVVSGNPTFDIDSSKVTFFKYALSYVTVNGERAEATDSEKGEYKFVLKEGVNYVNAYFSGRIEISATDLSTINWKSLLTVDNLLKLVYFVLTMAVTIGMSLVIRNLARNKRKSDDEIEATVENAFSQKVEAFLKDTVTPIVGKQNETTNDVLDAMNVLTRVTMFQLSGKPEDRLAALKELQDYKPANAELGEQIRKIVEDTIHKAEESKEAKKKAVAEAVESVNALGTENDAEIDTYDHVKL